MSNVEKDAWCLCGIVDDRGDGTCGNCGLWIMTEDDEACVVAPDGTDLNNPVIHRPGCSWETTPYCNCGADPERVLPLAEEGQPHA